MRPQDVIILLKFALNKQSTTTLPALSRLLGISASEISKSIQRSQYSGLISDSKRVATDALLEFIKYGLPYVFPAKPGAPTRGIPTAISHPQIKSHFKSDEILVWPHIEGTVRGQNINPLYPAFPGVVTFDPELYYAAALVDLFRVGKTREKRFAEDELRKLLKR